MAKDERHRKNKGGRPLGTEQQRQDNALLSIMSDGRPRTMTQLEQAGIDPWTVQRNRLRSRIERVHQGVYRANDAPADKAHEVAAASLRCPTGVICLTTAAWLHGLTVEQPGLWIALPKDAKEPASVDGTFTRWRNETAFQLGVDTMTLGGVDVPVTSPARTVFDLWRALRSSKSRFPDCFHEVFANIRNETQIVTDVGRIANEFGKLDETLDALIAASVQQSTSVKAGHDEETQPEIDDILAELDAETEQTPIEDIPDPDPDNDWNPGGYRP